MTSDSDHSPGPLAVTNPPVRTYSPELLLGHPLTLCRNICSDIMTGRGDAWCLFFRDFSALYRQTYFGYIWAFLPPLVSSLTFIFLNRQGIVQVDTGNSPYPAFGVVTVCALVAFFIGLVAFRIAMPHLIARMGG